ncbi:MAG TPA: hypothetical protein VLG47_04315 [Candidatus Saccharimonadales bacterium]|nr:hypothetical protein [Candidatus Saccharimonadales bacterium]
MPRTKRRQQNEFIRTKVSNTPRQRFILISVVILVAVCGLHFLFQSQAATFAVASEAENGTKAGNASSVADTGASSGNAVKFGGSVPSQCAKGGSFLWANLESCGWPGPKNTGPLVSQCPGGTLTANSGSLTRTITVTTANTVISCENITGRLDIKASNVTIKNVLISGSSGQTGTNANGTSVIYVEDGASATIQNVTINGNSGVHACVWHQGTSLMVDAINCYGIDDGVFSWADTSFSQTTGDGFTVKNSYFHDFTVKTANGHIDGYQTEGANNGMIDHNTFLMTSDSGNDSDSAVAIWDSLKSSNNITVQNNLIAGGGFAIYAEDYSPSESSPSGGFTVKNIFYKNNDFSTYLFSCVGSFGIWYPRGAPSDQWNRTGNTVLETSENVDNGNPHVNGSLCN